MTDKPLTFKIEDATLMYKNFEGREQQYNLKGVRGFSVVVPPDLAEALLHDGWNVKETKVREEGDIPLLHVPVAVNFNIKPPSIWLVSSRGRTPITEETVEMLDWANIKNVDLICRSFRWESNGKTGLKAYLQTMYVTLEEDELDQKYAEMEAG